jgi:chromodomain-helicase-DNA-binding protein 1
LAKKHRRRLQDASSRSASGLAGEVRFSTRQAGKVTTYNEEEGDDFSEHDADNLTPNYWAVAEDETPGIDIVLNHRVGEGKGALCSTLLSNACADACNTDTEYPDKLDYEFFVSTCSPSATFI